MNVIKSVTQNLSTKWSYLIRLHTASANVLKNAASQPLIRFGAYNIHSAMLQERLKLQ